MSIISIENLTKRYKSKVALDNISLEIKEGELFALLGVNGAGKSTLIKILSGLSKKSSGKVVIDGKDIEKDIDKIKGIIGISPQDTAVAGNLTVKENLEFFANIYGKSETVDLEELTKKFGFGEVLNQRARTLSGGYKRRLSIAIALIPKPKILFLDEPTLGLDIFSRRELWKIIEELKKSTTIILTSHYLEEIENLCDRVAILSKGHLLTIGAVEEIKQSADASTFEEAFIKLLGGK